MSMKLHYVVKTQKYFVRSAAGEPYDDALNISDKLCAPEFDITLIDSPDAYAAALDDSGWCEESTPYGSEDVILSDAANESISAVAEERASKRRLELGDEVSWTDNGVTYKGYVVRADSADDRYWCVSRAYDVEVTFSRAVLRYVGSGYKPRVEVKMGPMRGHVAKCYAEFVAVVWRDHTLPRELTLTAHHYLALEIING